MLDVDPAWLLTGREAEYNIAETAAGFTVYIPMGEITEHNRRIIEEWTRAIARIVDEGQLDKTTAIHHLIRALDPGKEE